MNQPGLIAIDWGTSSFRAFLLNRSGQVIEQIANGHGILNVPENDFEGLFKTLVEPWTKLFGILPVVMSGMIGSKQGWVEAPYLQCPASVDNIANAAAQLKISDMDLFIMPGLQGIGLSGAPDVMRGEETQIAGALSHMTTNSGLFCIPGTHSKWASVVSGKITEFSTFMTGETFAVMRDHSILGKLMSGSSQHHETYIQGLERSKSTGGLLHQLFGVRSEGLMGNIQQENLEAFMSGLLIGSEINEAVRSFGSHQKVSLIATGALGELYKSGLEHYGIDYELTDAHDVTIHGLHQAALKLGLLK